MGFAKFIENRRVAAQEKHQLRMEHKSESLRGMLASVFDASYKGVSIRGLCEDHEKCMPKLSDLSTDAAVLRLRESLLIKPAVEFFKYEVGSRISYMQGHDRREQNRMLGDLEKTLSSMIEDLFVVRFNFYAEYAREVISGETEVWDYKLGKQASEFPFGRLAEVMSDPDFSKGLAKEAAAQVKEGLDKWNARKGWGGLSAVESFHSM